MIEEKANAEVTLARRALDRVLPKKSAYVTVVATLIDGRSGDDRGDYYLSYASNVKTAEIPGILKHVADQVSRGLT